MSETLCVLGGVLWNSLLGHGFKWNIDLNWDLEFFDVVHEFSVDEK